MLVRRLFGPLLLLLGYCCRAHMVSPVLEESKGKAEGKIALTNNTFAPAAVVLEPGSFSVSPDGNGVYRPLAGDSRRTFDDEFPDRSWPDILRFLRGEGR